MFELVRPNKKKICVFRLLFCISIWFSECRMFSVRLAGWVTGMLTAHSYSQCFLRVKVDFVRSKLRVEMFTVGYSACVPSRFNKGFLCDLQGSS